MPLRQVGHITMALQSNVETWSAGRTSMTVTLAAGSTVLSARFACAPRNKYQRWQGLIVRPPGCPAMSWLPEVRYQSGSRSCHARGMAYLRAVWTVRFTEDNHLRTQRHDLSSRPSGRYCPWGAVRLATELALWLPISALTSSRAAGFTMALPDLARRFPMVAKQVDNNERCEILK